MFKKERCGQNQKVKDDRRIQNAEVLILKTSLIVIDGRWRTGTFNRYIAFK